MDAQDVIYRLRIDIRDLRETNQKLENKIYQNDSTIDDLKRQVKEFTRERNRAYDCWVLNGESKEELAGREGAE